MTDARNTPEPGTPRPPAGWHVHPLLSIRAKVFAVFSLLIVVTLVGNATQSGSVFMGLLTRQVEDSGIVQARAVSASVKSALGATLSQAEFAARNAPWTGPAAEAWLKEFLVKNDSFVSMHLLRTDARGRTEFKIGAVTARKPAELSGQRRKTLAADIGMVVTDLVTAMAKGRVDTVSLHSLAGPNGLPLVAIVVPFKDEATSKLSLWAVLTIQTAPILARMPAQASQTVSLVKSDGSLFLTTDPTLAAGRKQSRTFGKVARLIAAGSPQGAVSTAKTPKEAAKFGAFAAIPAYGLSVIVERDASAITDSIRKIVVKTALWGLLFVLFAALLAYFAAGGVTSEVRRVARATEQIATGNFDVDVRPKTRDEIGALTTSVGHMAHKIRLLLEEQGVKIRIERELALANTVQKTFFPKKAFESASLSVHGYYRPATECSGDWWWHHQIDEHRTFVCIADALGHGVSAALVTAMAHSAFLTHGELLDNALSETVSPRLVLERLNRILYKTFEGALTMTCFAMVVDTRAGSITYSMASHNAPFLVPKGIDHARFGKRAVNFEGELLPHSLRARGGLLGMSLEETFSDTTFKIESGDRIVLYTDGLIENSGPNDERFTYILLRKFLAAQSGARGAAMLEALVSKATETFRERPFDDDVTLVVVDVLEVNAQATARVVA